MNIILLQFDVSKKIMNSKQECGDETLWSNVVTYIFDSQLASLLDSIRDLHNNGFNGSIPLELAQASNLIQL
jgi:hypothetical protein